MKLEITMKMGFDEFSVPSSCFANPFCNSAADLIGGHGLVIGIGYS